MSETKTIELKSVGKITVELWDVPGHDRHILELNGRSVPNNALLVLDELSALLERKVVFADAAKVRPAPRTRASCTDADALEKMAALNHFDHEVLAKLEGIGSKRADRMIAKWVRSGEVVAVPDQENGYAVKKQG